MPTQRKRHNAEFKTKVALAAIRQALQAIPQAFSSMNCILEYSARNP